MIIVISRHLVIRSICIGKLIIIITIMLIVTVILIVAVMVVVVVMMTIVMIMMMIIVAIIAAMKTVISGSRVVRSRGSLVGTWTLSRLLHYCIIQSILS